MWSRSALAVSVALGSTARGRMPLHADRTSDRRTCRPTQVYLT